MLRVSVVCRWSRLYNYNKSVSKQNVFIQWHWSPITTSSALCTACLYGGCYCHRCFSPLFPTFYVCKNSRELCISAFVVCRPCTGESDGAGAQRYDSYTSSDDGSLGHVMSPQHQHQQGDTFERSRPTGKSRVTGTGRPIGYLVKTLIGWAHVVSYYVYTIVQWRFYGVARGSTPFMRAQPPPPPSIKLVAR